MGRVFEALKQAEAKGLEVPKRRERPEKIASEETDSAEAAEPLSEAVAPAEVTAEAVVQRRAPAPADVPSLAWGAPQTLVDPLVGGDWLAQVAGADLRPGSRLGGQYRRLRDRILSQLPRGVASAILLAGSERNVGTTTTAVHLACVTAEVAAADVLVVDVHVQNAGVAEKLNIDAEFGLADVLAGSTTWQQAVVRVPPGRVHVLDCGSSSSLAELLQAEPAALEALLADLKRRYRVVLIDGGTTDNELLSRWAGHCDGAYVLLELQTTAPETAARAVEQLRTAGADVLGCVLARGGLSK